MGWITRRIAGSITFTIVAVLLGSYAALRGWLVGGLSLATTTGAVILGIAALCSLAVTSRMKREDKEDRKSTRLNSSHSQISYAVFCLKKNTSRYLRPRQLSTGGAYARLPPRSAGDP